MFASRNIRPYDKIETNTDQSNSGCHIVDNLFDLSRTYCSICICTSPFSVFTCNRVLRSTFVVKKRVYRVGVRRCVCVFMCWSWRRINSKCQQLRNEYVINVENCWLSFNFAFGRLLSSCKSHSVWLDLRCWIIVYLHVSHKTVATVSIWIDWLLRVFHRSRKRLHILLFDSPVQTQ